MPFSKTTTRAFAASVALVAAGATVAGAAVFHLPILGFGSTAVASATVTPTTAHHARVAPRHKVKVKPRVIVKIRYVDDIVHRPAPAPAPAPAPVYTQPPAAAPSVALVSAPIPAAASPATIAPPPVARTSTTTAAPHTDDGHVEPADHEDGAPPTAGSATALQTVDR